MSNKKNLFYLFFSTIFVVLFSINAVVYAAEHEHHTIDDIKELEKNIPKFYDKYCTKESIDSLTSVLNNIYDAIDENITDENKIEDLYNQLEIAINDLKYKNDSVVPQVYITTDNGKEGSYEIH